jgi:hypothetical protein
MAMRLRKSAERLPSKTSHLNPVAAARYVTQPYVRTSGSGSGFRCILLHALGRWVSH